ncbi:MAG: MerR family transcriptional regulator [Actinobacteria bacterium]|nr:MerR family transcriptional regulator [Actinomycetota bacterium]
MKPTKKSFITIGELVEKLKEFYPDLTRSKLRFLESKGIITPKRAGNRYRIYHKDDVKKLNYILKMQKEYFMPLDVIKEKIDSVNFKRRAGDKSVLRVLKLKTVDKDRSLKSSKLTINEIKDKYKLSQEYINDLLGNNIISWKEEDGKFIIDGKDIEILNIICELSKYGIQIKHLK